MRLGFHKKSNIYNNLHAEVVWKLRKFIVEMRMRKNMNATYEIMSLPLCPGQPLNALDHIEPIKKPTDATT